MDNLPAEAKAAIATAIGGLIVSVLSAILGFHLGRPKQKAEINSQNASASESIAAAAETTTDTALRLVKELEARMTAQENRHNQEVSQLRQENATLKESLKKLEKLPERVTELERENMELRSKNAELEKLVRNRNGLGMK